MERRSFQKYLEKRIDKNEIEEIEQQAKFEKKTLKSITMKTKLIKHGNNLALIINQSLLDLLKIDENTELEISIENDNLIVTPDKNQTRALRDAKIEKIVKKVIKKYKPVLDKLAKT